MKNFTKTEVKQATMARELYVSLGRPSHDSFKFMLHHRLIANTTVTPADAKRALIIWGPDLGSLRGKTTRRKPSKVILNGPSIPAHILPSIESIILCIDHFFIGNICFFIIVSCTVRFITIECLPNKGHKATFAGLRSVIQLYNKYGHKVSHILGD